MTKKSVLLIKPGYYSRYPATALLKFSTYFKRKGWRVAYREGLSAQFNFYAEQIYITSLYTYEWRAVHEACLYYKKRFPRSNIVVGGSTQR